MNERLKELTRELDMDDVGCAIDSNTVKKRVNAALNADLSERRIYMRHKFIKTVSAAAAAAALFATTAFAVSPAGKEAVSSILEYFSYRKSVEVTSIKELEKYNEEIGESIYKDGYTLTLDNVAADDNFVHVFYTVKSDKPFYDDDSESHNIFYCSLPMHVECVIDGEVAGKGSNHNSYNGYFADAYTYKSVSKYNISGRNIPDSFKVELFGTVYEYDKESPVITKLYTDKYGEITKEEKADIWHIETSVDKSKVKVSSKTKEINVPLKWLGNGAVLEKAVFSPFGNQLVISTKVGSDDFASRIDRLAVFDENGVSLDILNTDLTENGDGSSQNSLEFLNANKDTKQLVLVPIEYISDEYQINYPIENSIGTYPIIYNVSQYGSVIVTDIRIKDGEIDIDYKKDGVVQYDPGFILSDDNGNNAEPGGKLGCVLYIDVHYDTNSYTARYVYDAYDDDGTSILMPESADEENLKKTFTHLGVFSQNDIKLDYSNAVTISLE